MSQSCVHQHTCSYTPGTHDPGICPMYCKIRYFPIISPCCPLLPHSPSAYPIKSPESLPFTLCHLSSITITLRFPCRVGLWEAATERKQKSTETPKNQVSKSGVSHQGASSPYPKNWGGKTLHFLPRFNTENPVGTQDLKRHVLSPTTGAGPKRETRGPASRKGKCPGEARWISPRSVRSSRNAIPRPQQWALFPRPEEASHRPGTRLPQDPASGTAPGSGHCCCSPQAARTHTSPARLLTVSTAPSPSLTLPGGRRRDVTKARRSTANGRSQKEVGGTLPGSPCLSHFPAGSHLLQQGSSVLPSPAQPGFAPGGTRGARDCTFILTIPHRTFLWPSGC